MAVVNPNVWGIQSGSVGGYNDGWQEIQILFSTESQQRFLLRLNLNVSMELIFWSFLISIYKN